VFNVNISGANPIALGDFDRNGLLDIAICIGTANVNGISTDRVDILLNQGNGVFGNPVTFVTGTSGGPLASIIAVGDFNNDGNPDIATAAGYGSVSVILGDGGGNFGAPLTFNANLGRAVQLTNLALADLNRDGKLDLVTAQNWPGVPGDASVGVYLGQGDGTFTLGVLYQPSVIDVCGACAGSKSAPRSV